MAGPDLPREVGPAFALAPRGFALLRMTTSIRRLFGCQVPYHLEAYSRRRYSQSQTFIYLSRENHVEITPEFLV